MRELFATYGYPFGSVLLSIAAFMVFLFLGVAENYEWFSRGGAVIVMFAVAAEFGLSQIYAEKVNERITGIGGLSGPVVKDLDIPPPYSSLRIVSHVLVVIGTIVWGFGDWFLLWIVDIV